MTLEELATYLGLKSTGSLRVQIRRGVLDARRIGKRLFLVSVQEAERYRAEHRAEGSRPGRRRSEALRD